MVLVTSHGFRGATIGSRHSIAMSAIAGSGTAMEQDYDYSSTLHAADLDSAEQIGRSAGERAVKRLNPRKVRRRGACRSYSIRGFPARLLGISPVPPMAAQIARKTSFLREKLGKRILRQGVEVIDDPLRKRGQRSRPFDAEGVATRKHQIN